MVEWIAERLLAMFNAVPALLVAEDSPNFTLIRAMFGLMLIVLLVYAIVMLRPSSSRISHDGSKASKPDRAER
jgi:hypothetical protein